MGEVDTPDFEHIWLSPKCDEEGDGRMWCEDDRGPCDDCGMPSTKYVRADLYDALASALAQAVKERDEAKRKAILWDKEGWQDLDAIKAQRDSALSQLAEARGENAWRPIESAPRDGRVVDYKTASGSLSDPGGEIGRMMWVVDDDQDYAGFWDFDRDQEAHPEWWAPPRPLPSPPH